MAKTSKKSAGFAVGRPAARIEAPPAAPVEKRGFYTRKADGAELKKLLVYVRTDQYVFLSRVATERSATRGGRADMSGVLRDLLDALERDPTILDAGKH